MNIESLANLAAITGVCIAAVNVIVEVLKAFWLKKETSRPAAVLVVSILLAFTAMYIYCETSRAEFTPLMGIGTFVGGFFIAYGAMFGYEKLYGAVFERVEKMLGQSDDGEEIL